MDRAYYPAAVAIAQREADKIGGTLTKATATLSAGKVLDGNVAHRQCTSGVLFNITLTGTFPIAYGGTPGAQGQIHTVFLKADAATGLPCLITVSPEPVKRSHGVLLVTH